MSDVLCDSYSESNFDLGRSINTYRQCYGQTFTGNGGTLIKVKFYLKKVGSPSSGTCRAMVHAHTGTWGSTGKPTGNALAYSDAFDVTSISDSDYALYEFTFSGENKITLEDGTHYCVCFQFNGGDSSNYVLFGVDSSSPTHEGNAYYYSTGWAYSTSGYDAPFYVYTEAELETLTTTIQSVSTVADLQAFNQTLLTSISSADSITDIQQMIDSLLVSVSALSSADDLWVKYLETLATVAQSVDGVTDVRGFIENVSVIAQSASTVADVLVLVETLAATIQSAASVSDIYRERKDPSIWIGRIPVSLVEIELDFCSRTFGSSPCTGTGEPCYNTYPTCKSKTNFSKTTKKYTFSSHEAPLPFHGPRPYVMDIDYYPTEIKTSLTVNNRIKVKMADDTDGDIGIDPYWSDRTSIQGTFWKKLLARNPNYKGRPVRIYEGFYGMEEEEFEMQFEGALDNISLADTVTVECVDLLKKLSAIDAPQKLDTKLVSALDTEATTITLNDVTGFPSSGYVRIGDEVIEYESVNTGTNQLLTCTRESFGTTAAEHTIKTKVQLCEYFALDSPYEHLKTMLTKGGIPTGNIDTDAFNALKTFPVPDIDYWALVTEPTKLDKLYWELVELLDCKSWVNEDLKVTICKVLPTSPGRSYVDINDVSGIIHGSPKVDLNGKSSYTRVSLYWDMAVTGKIDEPKDFRRLDVAIDADAEGEFEYNEVSEKEFFCRWIHPDCDIEEVVDDYVATLVNRYIISYRDPNPLVSFATDFKDSDIRTGGYIKLSSDVLLDVAGNALNKSRYQIVKRERKSARMEYVVLRLPTRKIAYIAPNDTPVYSGASEAQKEYGFIADNDGYFSDGEPAYTIY